MSEAPFTTEQIPSIIAAMTAAEKVDLLSGFGMWKTAANPRLNIPSTVMTDGTYGVRYSIEQIDNDRVGGQDFDAFLSIVNQNARDVTIAWGTMKAATCFPNGSSVGCSWDVDLLKEMGAALGVECQAFGVHLLLGPGINIRRTPLAGRSYEYYAEDPVLTGDLSAALINGLQGEGVGASLKHFAANNCEIERTSMDSVIDERALREVYLKGFDRAIRKSHPWTVMSSYNRLNGVQAAENEFLLNDLLRGEWNYDGLVVSDWHGIKDRPASLIAGNDLDMPESPTRKANLLAAVESGAVSTDVLDTACGRVLAFVAKVKAAERKGASFDAVAHHALARRIAGESIVLLKNAGAVLPLKPVAGQRLVIVGRGAEEPVIQGSGCATTTPTRVDDPAAEIRRMLGDDIVVDYYEGYSEDVARLDTLRAEAVSGAANADWVIVFADSGVGYDGEGSDRKHLGLAEGHDALIQALAETGSKVIVVLSNPDAVVMPWLDRVDAVLETFFSGQAMGGAVADIVFGKVNPSGKLTVTFPKKLSDVPGFHSYPGELGRHYYSEGIFVGHRWFDRREVEPLFPFGFGLSYTSFAYAGMALDQSAVAAGGQLVASFDVTNTGSYEGKEIAQLYARFTSPKLMRPVRELIGFAKVSLAPGETKRVSITIDAGDLAYYDPARHAWLLDNDTVVLEVGASSRDIRLQAPLQVESPVTRHRRLTPDTQPIFVLENPVARASMNRYLQKRLSVSEADADRLLEHCRNSFFSIFTTFERRLRQSFSATEIRAICEQVNAEMDAAEQAAA